MATMQEYLEEMARRQATGWTPGVPNRFAIPVSTTWNLPSTARTTMRQAVPRVNLGDISAQSNPQSTTKRRGRPRTTPEMLQSISDRAGTGTIKPMLGAISKIAGPAGIAAELLRSEPAVASELAPGTNPTDFRVTQAYPSMAVEEGYPNVSTLPSFDVTPDAGGAIGGVPGEQPMEKYGPSGYEGERIPPTGYRQIAPDTVIAASDFEVGPTSVAQVTGTRVPFVNVPSESSYHVSPQTDQDYLDLGVTPLGWDIAHPSESPMLDQKYIDAGYYGDPKGVVEDALAGILGGTINPAEVAVGGPQLSGAFPQYAGNPYGTMATEESDYGPFATPNFAGQQAPYGGPMMDTSLMSGFGKVGENVEEFVHYKDLVDKLVASGAVKAPTGYVSSVDVTNDLALPNIQHAMSSDTYGYQSGLKAALANEILGMGPKTWGTSQDIQELGRKFTGGGATPAMMDAQKQEGTRAINAALADPNITAMNTLGQSFEEVAFGPQGVGGFRYSKPSGTSLPVTPPDSMLMQDFIDKYGPVQSGTRDAYYHRDGTVRNAAGDIVATPDATYNEYAGMGQVASHPGQGGYIGDTERTIGEHLAAVNERVQAMPAVTTSQALSTQDERQQAMPEVSVPAPTAPTVAAQAAQNRLAQQQADAAIARAAQAAAARDAARQAQAASAAQAQAAQADARAVLAAAAGRDRGGPSSREIAAAREVLSQIDTFDSGGMMTETQRAMRDVGYGGGFAAGRGDTGATGQGGWT